MSGKATLVINSDSKDGQKAVETLVKEMAKLRDENKKLADENRKAAAERKEQQQAEKEANNKLIQQTKAKEKAEKEASDAAKKSTEQHNRDLDAQDAALARVGGTLMTMVGTYVSLNTVLDAVSKNYERQYEMQQRIAQQNQSVGAAQLEAALNMLGTSEGDKRDALGRIGEINMSTGFGDVGALNRAMASALSASGGNVAASLDALETGAKLSGGQPELLDAFTSASLGVSLRTGKSAEESLGAVLKAGTLGGVVAPDKQARLYRSVAASGAALDETGNTAEASRQSMVIAATLSNLVGDVMGESTGTATGSLETRLAEFFKGTGSDPGTSLSRISALQSDAKLAQQFDDKYNFEVKFDPVISRIIRDRNYQGSQMLTDYGQQLTYDKQAYDEQVQSVATLTPELRSLSRQNKARAAAESSMASNPNAGALAEIEALRQQAYDIAAPISSAPAAMFSTVGAIPRLLSRLGGEQLQAKALIAETRDIRDYFQDYEGIGVGGAQMSQARDQLDKLIALQEEALAEMKRNSAEQKRPTVTPQGMQEAN